MKSNSLSNEHYLLFAVLVIAFFTRILFITSIEAPFFDEKLFIPASYNYIERGFPGPAPWYHPYFRSVLLYFSINMFGDNPIGWRLPSVLIATSSVYFAYLLTLKLFSSRKIALVAAFLLAIDPLYISQSRINPDESIVIFALLVSFYCTLRYLENFNAYFLLIAGLMIGISVSVKWYAVFTMIFLLFISLTAVISGDEGVGNKLSRLFFIFLSLVILPETIYLLTFYPWFGRGHSLLEFFQFQRDMYVALQSVKISDFTNLEGLEVSKAYSWFIVPSLTGFRISLQGGETALLFLSNPFVWLLTLPSMFYMLLRCRVEKRFPLLIVVGAFIAHYAPLMQVKRPLYLHSALPVLPIAFIAIAYTLISIFDKLKLSFLLPIFIVFNLALVLMALPLLISYPFPADIYDAYLSWLDMFLVV